MNDFIQGISRRSTPHEPAGSTFALASQRPHTCNFLGSLRSNRASALNMLEQRGIKCLTNINKWEGKGAAGG